MEDFPNLVADPNPTREHLKHVEALESEVERLKKQLGDLHCTEVNALRRAYRTLCQHVDALDQESIGMAAELACLETDLVTPDVIATELGTTSALAVGLSVLHQALKVTPLATVKWVFRSMLAMGSAYVVWRLTVGTLSRVVALMGRNSERKRQLAAKLAVVEDRIHIMASLLNWSQAGPPTPVPSSQSLEQLAAPKPAPVAAAAAASGPGSGTGSRAGSRCQLPGSASAAAAALTVERLSGEVAAPGSGGSGSSSSSGRGAVPLPRPPRGPSAQGSPGGGGNSRAAAAAVAAVAAAAAAAASPATSQAATPAASPPRASSTAAALAAASGTPGTPAAAAAAPGPGLSATAGSPGGVTGPASMQPHATGSSPNSSGSSSGSKAHSRSGSRSSLPALEPLMRYAQLGSSPSAKQPSP